MSKTVDYYNNNAENYYWTTVGVDLDATRKRFASYLSDDATVIDIGCGSGRDVLAFCDMGYRAVGLDAAGKLGELAEERLGVKVIAADMSSWIADEPYDGVWCCASILHLDDKECIHFFNNLNHNLSRNGVLYLSVKSGIKTGVDKEGRYIKDYSEEDIRELTGSVEGLKVKDIWYTEDALQRNETKWMNVIALRNGLCSQ